MKHVQISGDHMENGKTGKQYSEATRNQTLKMHSKVHLKRLGNRKDRKSWAKWTKDKNENSDD